MSDLSKILVMVLVIAINLYGVVKLGYKYLSLKDQSQKTSFYVMTITLAFLLVVFLTTFS